MTGSKKSAPIPDGGCTLCGGKGRAGKVALTLSELSATVPFGKTKLYALIAEGRLRAVKCDKRTLIRTEDLYTFLASLPPMGGCDD